MFRVCFAHAVFLVAAIDASGCGGCATPPGEGEGEPPPPIALTAGAWTPNRGVDGDVLLTDFPQLPATTWVTVAGDNNTLRSVEPLPNYPSGYGPSSFDHIVSAPTSLRATCKMATPHRCSATAAATISRRPTPSSWRRTSPASPSTG